MGDSIRSTGLPRPGKMLSATGKVFSTDAALEDLSGENVARRYGRDFARALEIGGFEPQVIAAECAYVNQSPISKLINTVDPSPAARLVDIDRFRVAYIQALAERTLGVSYEAVLRIPRRRA